MGKCRDFCHTWIVCDYGSGIDRYPQLRKPRSRNAPANGPLESIVPCIIWVFPKIGVPQNGWFMMENHIKMDDLGVPLFLETPI